MESGMRQVVCVTCRQRVDRLAAQHPAMCWACVRELCVPRRQWSAMVMAQLRQRWKARVHEFAHLFNPMKTKTWDD
jgi:hypothetical protein